MVKKRKNVPLILLSIRTLGYFLLISSVILIIATILPRVNAEIFSIWDKLIPSRVLPPPVSSGFGKLLEEAREQAEPVEIIQPDNIRIPKIGVNVPLVYPTSIEEKDIQIALANGIVHYPYTPLPGQTGNAYYLGHSSDFIFKPGKFKTVFSRLPEIAKGDQILFYNSGNLTVKAVVAETKITIPTDISVFDQPAGRKIVTLQTSYPVGTALKRFTVIANIVP